MKSSNQFTSDETFAICFSVPMSLFIVVRQIVVISLNARIALTDVLLSIHNRLMVGFKSGISLKRTTTKQTTSSVSGNSGSPDASIPVQACLRNRLHATPSHTISGPPNE
jgi:hypothetical protein